MTLKRFLFPVVGICLLGVVAWAQSAENPPQNDDQGEGPQYGEFVPILLKQEVVEDINIKDNDLMIKIREPYREKDVIVKISDAQLAQYRYWLNNGQTEFPIRTYRGGDRQGYTYRIRTSAAYIEYWIDDELVLHLKRKDAEQ
ncbi:MAG: hypothetical protein HQM12_12325 [SAR324 cluster bacterium]|nr:hypothetical protein [SAR324 cluster bacterium]